jgi:hypothetical protein
VIERVHEHIVSELQQNARTDTVFVVTAVAFNLVVLGISWAVAGNGHGPQRGVSLDWILALLVVITGLINFLAVRALAAGKRSRLTLLKGLMEMYRDQGVDRYYDAGLLESYATRYRLFTGVVVLLASVSIGVPLLARFLG